jgi:putative ABC transport system permease protein
MFSVLALFTACLGLSGLAAFLVERRKKEIGIRKVLGASVRNLVLTQTREFGFWVLLANIIAWPAAYFAVGRWLQGFAYHVRPGVAPAVIAAVFSLAVALLAVGYKAFRASLANPIDSLKYE